MSSALTVIQPTAIQPIEAQQGGIGLDFNSKLLRLKPATLNINQPNTQVDGAVKGNLRVVETGEEYKEMFVTFLRFPLEQRAFYEGEPGQLNRSQENLMCLCRNVTYDGVGDDVKNETSGPDNNARVPQAFNCRSCSKSSWDTWRKTKRKEDLPPCDKYYHVYMLDTQFGLPMQMFIRSKNKAPFEAAMKNFARTIKKLQSQGLRPNIFDIGFKLTTKQILTGKLPSYVLNLSDFRLLTDDERQEFGPIFQQFTEQATRSAQEQNNAPATEQQQIAESEQTIDADVVEGEIVI